MFRKKKKSQNLTSWTFSIKEGRYSSLVLFSLSILSNSVNMLKSNCESHIPEESVNKRLRTNHRFIECFPSLSYLTTTLLRPLDNNRGLLMEKLQCSGPVKVFLRENQRSQRRLEKENKRNFSLGHLLH